jgi:parallel beta-helix repeat protein
MLRVSKVVGDHLLCEANVLAFQHVYQGVTYVVAARIADGTLLDYRQLTVANTTTVLQAALTYVNSVGGGSFYLAAALWTINATLLVYSDTKFGGAGYESWIFLAAGSNCSVIRNADRVGGNSNITIEHLRIDGNKANQVAYGRPIDFKNVTQSKILFNWCLNAFDGATEATRSGGIYLEVTTYTLVQGNVCSNCGHAGINLRNSSNFNRICENYCYDNDWHGIQIDRTGEEVTACYDNIVVGNICNSNDHDGIDCHYGYRNDIIGNVCASNVGCGIWMEDPSANNNISGNTCYGNGTNNIILNPNANFHNITGNYLLLSTSSSIYLEAGTEGNNITGNYVYQAQHSGIFVMGCIRANIVGNYLYNVYDAGIDVFGDSRYSNITGNLCVNCNIAGIRIGRADFATNCVGVSVTGNLCYGSIYQGIYLDTYCVSANVTGNLCAFNGYSGIYVKSSYNTITGNACINNCQSTARAGIYLSGANYNTITSNVCTDNQATKTQDYGISATGTNQYNVIALNVVAGNQVGGISVAAFDGTNKIEENVGYNPVGNIANPFPAGAGYLLDVAAAQAFPSSGVVYTVGHSPKLVCISGGTVTQIAIDGVNTNLIQGAFHLNPGNTITVTWTGQPLGVVSAC